MFRKISGRMLRKISNEIFWNFSEHIR
jgi:hypothetical protein